MTGLSLRRKRKYPSGSLKGVATEILARTLVELVLFPVCDPSPASGPSETDTPRFPGRLLLNVSSLSWNFFSCVAMYEE